MSGTEPMPPEVWQQVERFVHLGWHLKSRKAGREPSLIVDCWDMIWTGVLPDWALRLAQAGEPGTLWCPILRPDLRG